MKLVSLLILLTTSVSFAETPKMFQNSKIVRVLNNGKVQVFDGNDYKIVRRDSKPRVIKITKTIKKKLYMRRTIRKRSLSINTGYSDSFFLGIGMSKDINEAFRMQGIITTNGIIMGGFGYNY